MIILLVLTVISGLLWRVFAIKDSLRDTFRTTVIDEKAFEQSLKNKIDTPELIKQGVLKITRIRKPHTFYYKLSCLCTMIFFLSFIISLIILRYRLLW